MLSYDSILIDGARRLPQILLPSSMLTVSYTHRHHCLAPQRACPPISTFDSCAHMHMLPCALQTEACVADCTSALEADPGRVKAYFRRALAREQLGEDGDALRDAKRALEVFLRCQTTIEVAVGLSIPSPTSIKPSTPLAVSS